MMEGSQPVTTMTPPVPARLMGRAVGQGWKQTDRGVVKAQIKLFCLFMISYPPTTPLWPKPFVVLFVIILFFKPMKSANPVK
jgi:hypothetical protein